MLNRRCVWLWIFVLRKEFTTPPNVACEIVLATATLTTARLWRTYPVRSNWRVARFSQMPRVLINLRAGRNQVPTPEQNITSVRWYVSHCRVLRHPTKENMAHGETSGPAATDPGSSSCTCRLLRSHMTSTIRSEWTQATHRVLRCTHDSREAPLSAAPVVPVTSLDSPVWSCCHRNGAVASATRVIILS